MQHQDLILSFFFFFQDKAMVPFIKVSGQRVPIKTSRLYILLHTFYCGPSLSLPLFVDKKWYFSTLSQHFYTSLHLLTQNIDRVWGILTNFSMCKMYPQISPLMFDSHGILSTWFNGNTA